MNMHKHAKLTPLGRERRVQMMLDGRTPAKAAALACYRRLGVTVKRVMTNTVAEPAEAMGRAIPLMPSPPLANNSASNTSEPNPIPPGPMARPNASSKPPGANGPMPELIKPQNSAPKTCHYGRIAIIGIDPIAA